jgi:hypothetical protein
MIADRNQIYFAKMAGFGLREGLVCAVLVRLQICCNLGGGDRTNLNSLEGF